MLVFDIAHDNIMEDLSNAMYISSSLMHQSRVHEHVLIVT